MGRRANLQKSDGGRVPRPWRGTRSELGRTRPARGGGDAPSRQGRGRPSAGTGGSRPARGGGRHPHGSDSTSEPTPPIYIRGGATIPYIYKGIVRSYDKTRIFYPPYIRGG
jgi:hypothetical protein